jgi:phosphatidylinositol alpha-1,6-mannosyltransferase
MPLVSRVLVVTNDFPPRAGGIQAFVHALTTRLPDVVVFASTSPGSERFDARQPFEVVRQPTSLLLPTPAVARRVADVARSRGCGAAWFGAAAPLGLLAAALRKAGVGRIVATTHGHEVGWAMLPGARQLLRKISADVDVLTYLGEYTRNRLAKVASGRASLQRLAPGVDTGVFRPDAGGAPLREHLGLAGRPVVVCVSRLVPRKGQDTLIRALPAIRRAVPDAVALMVGAGPYRARLERLAAAAGVAAAVQFAGGVSWEDLPSYYDAGDVFAMPCRTRRAGLDVEGLGIVYLEASAAGLPVVAGDSGGAPDAVLDGETGWVVDGRDVDAVAARISGLLADPAAAKAMGAAGRAWVEQEWTWDAAAGRLQEMLLG